MAVKNRNAQMNEANEVRDGEEAARDLIEANDQSQPSEIQSAADSGVPKVPGNPVSRPESGPVRTKTGKVRVRRADVDRLEADLQERIENSSSEGRSAVNLKGLFRRIKQFAEVAAPIAAMLIPGSAKYIQLLDTLADLILSPDEDSPQPA